MFRSKPIIIFILLFSLSVHAAKLAIVIDDVGYQWRNEQLIFNMPVAISVAILPNSPHGRQMAEQAHRQGREILIHLPMAPKSKQPLERDTLTPLMTLVEIQRIIRQAVNQVPYAVGLNNHMGSAMTANLPAMQKVMRALAGHPLYFLDSLTTGNSQSAQANVDVGVPLIKRDIFLDDSRKESDIRHQLYRAIQLAQKQGFAIAIGHPHSETVRVLQQVLPKLPADIILVKPSALLGVVPHLTHQKNVVTTSGKSTVSKLGICPLSRSIEPVTRAKAVKLILDSLLSE